MIAPQATLRRPPLARGATIIAPAIGFVLLDVERKVRFLIY